MGNVVRQKNMTGSIVKGFEVSAINRTWPTSLGRTGIHPTPQKKIEENRAD